MATKAIIEPLDPKIFDDKMMGEAIRKLEESRKQILLKKKKEKQKRKIEIKI